MFDLATCLERFQSHVDKLAQVAETSSMKAVTVSHHNEISH